MGTEGTFFSLRCYMLSAGRWSWALIVALWNAIGSVKLLPHAGFTLYRLHLTRLRNWRHLFFWVVPLSSSSQNYVTAFLTMVFHSALLGVLLRRVNMDGRLFCVRSFSDSLIQVIESATHIAACLITIYCSIDYFLLYMFPSKARIWVGIVVSIGGMLNSRYTSGIEVDWGRYYRWCNICWVKDSRHRMSVSLNSSALSPYVSVSLK